jgi:hypothetical protein
LLKLSIWLKEVCIAFLEKWLWRNGSLNKQN